MYSEAFEDAASIGQLPRKTENCCNQFCFPLKHNITVTYSLSNPVSGVTHWPFRGFYIHEPTSPLLGASVTRGFLKQMKVCATTGSQTQVSGKPC